MSTSAHSRVPACRRAALAALAALALALVPLAVRAADASFRWCFYDGKTHSSCGASDEEVRGIARSLGGGRSFLWVARDGEPWLIRDPALLERARTSIEPVQQLGGEMGRLGSRQGELGARQGRFGAEMGRIGAQQGRLGARLAQLSLRDDEDGVAERDEIRSEMRELRQEMRELERRKPAGTEGEMSALGRRLGEMGQRMGELSRRAERELRDLTDEAISSGRARRVRESGEI